MRTLAGVRLRGSLRVLFLVSAHNSLSQRAWIALTELGHEVTVAVVDSAAAMEAAVEEHRPQLIVCPMLKRMIPESIWARHRCLIVHPGPWGDRGPSSLDWAIELGAREWGVTVLEANGEADAGDVWATRRFPTREVGKSSLYRHEVRRAAIEALVEAMGRIVDGSGAPDPAELGLSAPAGRARPLMGQDVRAIDWHADATDTVVRKIRAAEGHPGVLDAIDDTEFHLFGVHPERALRGRPGEIVAQRTGAICRATVDGAVWITHLKRRDTPTDSFFKLPATRALALACPAFDAPEIPVAVDAALPPGQTFREIAYEEDAGVGYLHFDFYNGAMSTEQCRRLHEAFLLARSRPETKVIALMGGSDFFSNGIHLNVIEAADDPAAESWSNLRAIDDLVREIIETDSHVVLSALAGDAAAGGVPFALAADCVVARKDVVLNPYYRHMGGLFGSEYWTYLLPRRVGPDMTARLTGPPFTPVGLLDAAFGATVDAFRSQVRALAGRLAVGPDVDLWLAGKRRGRALDEEIKPLDAYRKEELARSYACCFGEDRGYHEARRRFVHKLGAPCAVTPSAAAPADALVRVAGRAA
jgi:putative two-component system protein, hydrogenase maturation factor HypX/HoxX